jgi:hypothetical protein
VKRSWAVFATFALFLGISLTVLWGVIGLGPIKGWIPVATFATAILITLVMAALAAGGARRRRGGEGDQSAAPRAIPDFSFPPCSPGSRSPTWHSDSSSVRG